jgi:energy-converting hydrogenase Eha subunit A
MGSRRFLVAVSATQLAAGIAGHLVALRERRGFDIALLGWRGQPERVVRDSWLLGTGLSAPVIMLSIQAAAIIRLARRPSHTATRVLGILGATMTSGYLIEQEFRAALSPTGWNTTTTPIATAGFTLAIPMAVIGLRKPVGN